MSEIWSANVPWPPDKGVDSWKQQSLLRCTALLWRLPDKLWSTHGAFQGKRRECCSLDKWYSLAESAPVRCNVACTAGPSLAVCSPVQLGCFELACRYPIAVDSYSLPPANDDAAHCSVASKCWCLSGKDWTSCERLRRNQLPRTIVPNGIC